MGFFVGIMGNLFDEGSTPAIIVIEADEVGSCFTVQKLDGLPKNSHPKIPLEANMVSGTTWESMEMDIALISLPTLVPIPFGIDFQLHTFNDAFTDKMCKISTEHGFWAKTMVDVIKQVDLNKDSTTIVERLISSRISS
jgi:hypothetical protein